MFLKTPCSHRSSWPTALRAKLLPTAVALAAAFPVSSQAVSPTNGDTLYWQNTTGETDWDSHSAVWNDLGGVQAGPGPISLYGNEGTTFGFFFIGDSPPYGTVAPTSMTISAATFNADYVSFVGGFNSTNSMTIGGGRTNLYTQMNFVDGSGINDRANSGTITFNPGSGGNNGALFFNLAGSLSISPNTGTSIVLNVGVTGNNGSIGKSDGGTLTLASSLNGYGGTTTVTGGTLVVLSQTGSGAVTVSNTGTLLTGTGSLFGGTTVNAGATISPGTLTNSTGTLSLYNGGTLAPIGLTLNGTYKVDIGNGGADLLNVASGTIVIGAGTSNTSMLSLGSVDRSQLKVNAQYLIAQATGATGLVVGTFSNAANNSTITDAYGDMFEVNYTSNQITLTVESLGAAPVPEPATWFASSLAAGMALATWMRRRRRTVVR